MDTKAIINNINEFFSNAPEKDIQDIMEAFSIDIKGDVSIEQYLDRFQDLYPYVGDEDLIYRADAITLHINRDMSLDMKFVEPMAIYAAKQELDTSISGEKISKYIKKAA